MAEAIVGGAFLSGFINVVFDRLLSPEALNLIRGKKLDHELLDRLKIALLAAEALVDDAEKKQFHDTRVKKWQDDLKDAVYTADDLLDTVFTKAATQSANIFSVSNFLACFINFKDREMEEIVRRIEALEKHKDTLGLKKNSKEKLSWRVPSTSLIAGEIYGRENDKEAMMKLLKDENTYANISVIPIVGMGRVGKTTLARWLYHNEDLMKEFDLKAWVCVSEDSNIVKITQSIIEVVTGGTCDKKDLNLLQLDLKDNVIGKKFFIVLDDVWKHVDWISLKKPFQYGMKGSKILVTTRNKEVASVFQTCPPYLLNELSDEYCWSVLANHACFPESNGNPTLEKIGREIVKKCKGLPLAAQTLGSLLRVKHDVKDWKNVLISEIWEFSIKDSMIIPALLISYFHLPPHLKRCFVYCSLYPRAYRIYKEKIILLWMAEDLLPQPKEGKTLEEVGYECFNELTSMLFFKQFSINDGSFVMHDLFYDLATYIAGEFYFGLEELGNADEMSMRTRHLSYERLSHPISNFFDVIGRVKSLRSLLPINFSNRSFSIGSTSSLILSELKWLRVLSFASFQDLDILPESIGELIHLRYLDLSKTSIKTLPESSSNLYNLQTLKLIDCDKVTLLPNGMQNLVNLRHLDISGTKLKKMPRGMSKLINLQQLDYFVVGKHEEENGIMELGELSNIHGSLSIRKLENVGCSNEALKARIKDKTHIETLDLRWSTGVDMVPSISSVIERDILDKLQPHKCLQVLTIEGYRGTSLPDWVGHSSYHNMTHLSLRSCSNCCRLPSLGQLPSLKFLSISDFNGLEKIGEEFYKSDNDHSSLAAPFPSLESLEFDEMSSWEEWHSSQFNAFPQLKNLNIFDCPRLTGNLPDHLTCLQSLCIYDCSCAISFSGNCIPVSVTDLEISDCRKLKFPREQQHELLQSLSITNSCDSLTSFPLDNFPKLKYLMLDNCENLESLSASQPQNAALHHLEIARCPNLVSFPGEGLAAPSMSRFWVFRCDKLKSLPCHMNTLLPKLEELEITNCPEIELFPDGGLPPNLELLRVSNCVKLLSGLSSMGLHYGLIVLAIGGPCESVKSFPKEGSVPQLPSLAKLSLSDFPSMETLDCKELLHLTSLRVLSIEKCPNLENMSGEKLPASLTKLQISNSPLLEERCKMKDSQIWPKISHIPSIRVDDKWIT